MLTSNALWVPLLSPKDQKRFNERQEHRWSKVVKWIGLSDKTLLDLLSVLLVPIVIAAATIWFSMQQSVASSQASERQHQTDLQITQDQQQENALQTYLDRMSDLLLNNKLHESQPGDEVSNVARARTLTVLSQLNGIRKGDLVRFLQEAGLIDRKNVIVGLNGSNLSSADLSRANLSSANLSGANLSGANLSSANLSGTNLSLADLWSANLSLANLNHTDLNDTNLSFANLNHSILIDVNLNHTVLIGANLSFVNLGGANLSLADLRSTNLRGVNFRDANLSSATFWNANLRDANLSSTSVTQEQLKQAESLQGAIMPDGSVHP